MTRPVAPEGLRVVRDPSALPFHSTSEPCPPEGLIGQEREAGAMAFGVGMRHAGYNLFVLSAARTGKTSSMKRVLAQAAAREPAPADPCYVHNFADPYRPTALAMPFGRARELQDAMRRLVDECRTRLPRAFESEEFERQKSCIVEDLGAQQREEVARLEEAARSRRFTVLHGPGGLTLAPAPHGEPLTTMEYEALPAAMKETIREHSEVLEAHMEATHRRLRQLKRDARNAHERLVRDVAAAAVCPLFQELREQFAALPAVDQYLNDVEKDLVAHAEQLHGPDDGKLALPFLPPPGAFLDRYRVNVLVDRTGVVSAPVLLEPHPTHGNLVGRTEHRAYFGTLVTDRRGLPGGGARALFGWRRREAHRALLKTRRQPGTTHGPTRKRDRSGQTARA